jgi:hypothetical protein
LKAKYKEVTGQEYVAPGQAKKPQEPQEPKPTKEKKPEMEKKAKVNTLTPEQQVAIQAAKDAKEKEGKSKQQKGGTKPAAASVPIAASAASSEAEATRRFSYFPVLSASLD